jgi:hypothetical protein
MATRRGILLAMAVAAAAGLAPAAVKLHTSHDRTSVARLGVGREFLASVLPVLGRARDHSK